MILNRLLQKWSVKLGTEFYWSQMGSNERLFEHALGSIKEINCSKSAPANMNYG
jgi:hypothetical protein